jgi:hypothetical protein
VHFWGLSVYYLSTYLIKLWTPKSEKYDELCYPFEKLQKDSQSAFLNAVTTSVLASFVACSVAFYLAYKLIQRTVYYNSSSNSSHSSPKLRRFLCTVLGSLQCIFGFYILPAFSFFSVVMIMPLFVIKFDFWRQGKSYVHNHRLQTKCKIFLVHSRIFRRCLLPYQV